MKKIIFRVTCICAVAVMALSSCLRDKVVKPDDSKDYDEAYLEELRKLGDVAFVNLHLAIEGEQDADKAAETRAPLLDESITSYYNCYVFQFASDSLGSLMMTPPYYVDDTKIANYKANPSANPIMVPLLESRGYQTRIVVVGNINDRAYNWGLTRGKHKYRDLLGKYITLTNEGVSYGGTKENLVMAWSDMKVISDPQLPSGTQTDLKVEFHRSVAKIALNLKVATGFKVTKVQMKSVSNRLNICDYLMEQHPDTAAYFTTAADVVSPYYITPINYDAINWDGTNSLVPDDGSIEHFVWYAPRNMRSIRPSATVSTRNVYAPYGATYFEVYAIAPNGNGVIYTIYPGENAQTFDLLPSRQYITDLNITNDGQSIPADSRVQRFDDIELDGNSNSYIINPPLVGTRRYKIPVVRVNQYWNPVKASYGAVNQNVIFTTTQWQATVLWQDAPDIVRPTDSCTLHPDIPYVELKKPLGTGVWTTSANTAADAMNGTSSNNDGYFEIDVPAGAKPGNFVIALRIWDPSGGTAGTGGWGIVRWSWHFWVTDYNPNFVQTKNMKDCVDFKQFVYTVPNGFVERYGGTVWGYSGTITNNWNSYSAATTTPTTAAPYAKSFIMDRYLGALNNNQISHTDRGIIYYQFGRKDPFPGNITLYTLAGDTIKAVAPATFVEQKWNANANVSPGAATATAGFIQQAVMYPMTFYSSAGDWSGLVESTYLWHDSDIQKTDVFGKSIFDPCPPGWAVPVAGVFADFRGNAPGNAATPALTNMLVYTTMSNIAANNVVPKASERGGLHWDNSPMYYMKYYPYVTDAKGGHSLPPRLIMFPANGYRNGTSGVAGGSGNNGRGAADVSTGYNVHCPVWTATPGTLAAIPTGNTNPAIPAVVASATNGVDLLTGRNASLQFTSSNAAMSTGGTVRCVSQVQP